MGARSHASARTAGARLLVVSALWSCANGRQSAPPTPPPLARIAVSPSGTDREPDGPDASIRALDDESRRSDAVRRLERAFADALTRANHDPHAPEVQSLAARAFEPLVRTYVEHYAELGVPLRVELIRVLALLDDPRIEPAVRKAFEEFAASPPSSKDERDVQWAAIAVKKLELTAIAKPLLDVFDRFHASTPLGAATYPDVNAAMVGIADRAWLGALTEKLTARMEPPKSARDAAGIPAFQDQAFWQTTAAQVLGVIRDPSSVRPLLRILLDPAKRDVHAAAVLALVRIGKPSVDAALVLLDGRDTELVAFAEQRTKELVNDFRRDELNPPEVATAAYVLGDAGRPDAIPGLIAALTKTKGEVPRALVAGALAKIPATPASERAFQRAFETISVETAIPPGDPALEVLSETATRFHDPALVPWLLERARSLKGASDEEKSLQAVITVSALKLARPDQLPALKHAVDRYGTEVERDLYAQTASLLGACGVAVSCYLSAIENPQNRGAAHRFTGVKAGAMLGILGDERTRDELVARIDAIDDAAVRFAAAQSIDHLSPKGSKEVARALREIVDRNWESQDWQKAAADTPLTLVSCRLEGRAD